MIKDLTQGIKETEVDQTEQAYIKWCQKREYNTNSRQDIKLPQFHIENSVRKWGKTQVETLNIQNRE